MIIYVIPKQRASDAWVCFPAFSSSSFFNRPRSSNPLQSNNEYTPMADQNWYGCAAGTFGIRRVLVSTSAQQEPVLKSATQPYSARYIGEVQIGTPPQNFAVEINPFESLLWVLDSTYRYCRGFQCSVQLQPCPRYCNDKGESLKSLNNGHGLPRLFSVLQDALRGELLQRSGRH